MKTREVIYRQIKPDRTIVAKKAASSGLIVLRHIKVKGVRKDGGTDQ